MAQSPGEPNVLRYTVTAEPFEIELTLPGGAKQKRQLPRQPHYFVHRVNVRWPIPDGPDGKLVRCEIRWIGFPAEFRLINSYDMDSRHQVFETTIPKLRKAVFAGGELRAVRSPNGHYLVTQGEWKFSDAQLLERIDRIVTQHTAVWKDEGLPDHRVFLFPRDGSWAGEGRTNASILEGQREFSGLAEAERLLSHEMFHQWNGRRLNWDNNEELYWFTEGFTDYYAVTSLWRAGLWSFDDVLNDFNRVARRYYASTSRNLTPSRMVALRQSNTEANGLPYQQGYLLAAHWNLSGKSLDRAMQYLRHNNSRTLSNSRIAQALRSIGIAKAAGEIQRFIVQGQTIELGPNVWGRCATRANVQVRAFDFGFDEAESAKSGTIQGLKADSNAWRAGVRDGQRWKPFDVVWGDPAYEIGIEIEDEQGKRRVRYYPAATNAVAAPHYKAAAGSCNPDTFRLAAR